LAELRGRGFAADVVFDMTDMIVALDTRSRAIAFANVELQVFRPGRSRYLSRFTIVEPFDKLEGLDVWISPSLITLTAYFNAPSTFDSKTKLEFSTAPQSRAQVRALVAAWPGARPASIREST